MRAFEVIMIVRSQPGRTSSQKPGQMVNGVDRSRRGKSIYDQVEWRICARQ
jgi:hypothetical protein